MWQYNYNNESYPFSDELMHYGVIGMKWRNHVYASRQKQLANYKAKQMKKVGKVYDKHSVKVNKYIDKKQAKLTKLQAKGARQKRIDRVSSQLNSAKALRKDASNFRKTEEHAIKNMSRAQMKSEKRRGRAYTAGRALLSNPVLAAAGQDSLGMLQRSGLASTRGLNRHSYALAMQYGHYGDYNKNKGRAKKRVRRQMLKRYEIGI